MTIRKRFERAVARLVEQGEPCVIDYGCRYRHEGKACAIGHMMADAEYDRSFESLSVDALIRRGMWKPSWLPRRRERVVECLEAFQSLHDQTPEGPNFIRHFLKGYSELREEYAFLKPWYIRLLEMLRWK